MVSVVSRTESGAPVEGLDLAGGNDAGGGSDLPLPLRVVRRTDGGDVE
jgi:hypothetical protein